ncbi:hypothetical protein ONZ45_g9421 [Pleurotus djamor]|nr:hypothetical protein ONZ45_g9421 [Pleurotus djamor]
MHFKTGTYRILSAANTQPVGLSEELSTYPVGITCLPVESKEIWKVERIDHDRYTFVIAGTHAGVLEDKLFAFPDPVKVAVDRLQWLIEAHARHPGLCTITSVSDPSSGWVLSYNDSGDHVVDVKPLIVGESSPPYYPKGELWKLELVTEDGQA